MSFHFDSLYQDYVTLSKDMGLDYSVQDFLDDTSAMVNSRLQDGEDPRPQDLFIIEYAKANDLYA